MIRQRKEGEEKDLEKSDKEQKELKGDEEDPKMGKTKIFFKCVIIALLMAPAMLVAPLLVAPYILVITLLFAVACILGDKLKENEKAISQINGRFGDVFIGIISGIVAAGLIKLDLVTFGKTPVFLPFLSMVASLLVVAFSVVVIWVFFTTQKSR